ncbi:MAG TPA: ADOP family duplicated permease [Vicinamibacterales bacterium]
MRIILWLVSFVVPYRSRGRWREEWRAELRHGGWRMLTGALPDAWAMRTLARQGTARASWKPFHAIDQDVRYAVRGLAKGKSYTVAVIGSLAIGIGATTAAFAIVNATFFRPFPEIHAEEELVRTTIGWGRAGAWLPTTWDDYQLLRQNLAAVEDLSISHVAKFAVATNGGGEPRTVVGQVVSAGYFDVLGVRPALGRFFSPEDDAAPWSNPAVVVSHRYWTRYLESDLAAVQRTLNVNGTDLPIIGVAPEGFEYGNAPQVWITFALSDLVFRDPEGRAIHVRNARPFGNQFIGRLRSGVTIEQARAQAAGLGPTLEKMRDRGVRTVIVRVDPLRIEDPAAIGLQALALMIIPIIVLAIACVNAANLLLARATTQSADWLTRLALGATGWRLIRQVLVESSLLALAAGGLGLIAAYWSTGFVQDMTFRDVVIDGDVALFAILAAIATAVVFGLGPAFTVTRTAVARAPEAGRFLRGPFGSRTRSVLVILQAALCLGLLATSALFTRALREMWDDGLPEPSQFLAASLDLDQLRYTPSNAREFYSDLLLRVQDLPAVKAAALTDRSVRQTLSGLVGSSGLTVSVPGQPEPVSGTLATYTTSGYFQAMGLRFVEGRTFAKDEQHGAPRVVVVNQEFVKRAFGENPLGRIVTLTAVEEGGDRTSVDAMVVGVIENPPGRPIFARLPNVFFPAPLRPAPTLDLAVRFNGDAKGIASAIRTIVSAMEPRLPVDEIATGDEFRRRRNSNRYTLTQAVSLLGILSLALAAAGLYGVVSYMVTLRQKEIGIRMALGAASAAVLRLVLRQSLVPVLAGCVLGAFGAAVIAKVTRAQLYGVSPMDPVAFGGATLLLLAVMVVASLVPARRAASINPVDTLRRE